MSERSKYYRDNSTLSHHSPLGGESPPPAAVGGLPPPHIARRDDLGRRPAATDPPSEPLLSSTRTIRRLPRPFRINYIVRRYAKNISDTVQLSRAFAARTGVSVR